MSGSIIKTKQRIPLSLQRIFLDSNRGQEVNQPPEKSASFSRKWDVIPKTSKLPMAERTRSGRRLLFGRNKSCSFRSFEPSCKVSIEDEQSESEHDFPRSPLKRVRPTMRKTQSHRWGSIKPKVFEEQPPKKPMHCSSDRWDAIEKTCEAIRKDTKTMAPPRPPVRRSLSPTRGGPLVAAPSVAPPRAPHRSRSPVMQRGIDSPPARPRRWVGKDLSQEATRLPSGHETMNCSPAIAAA